MTKINIGSQATDVEVEVILKNDPMYYVDEEEDTIGDYDVPLGTTTETYVTVDLDYSDVLHIYHEIETCQGIIKVDLLPYIEVNIPLFKDVIMTTEQAIRDDYERG